MIFFISPTTAAIAWLCTRQTRLSKKRSGLTAGPPPGVVGGGGGDPGGGDGGEGGLGAGGAGFALNFLNSLPKTLSGSVRVSKFESLRNDLTTSLSFASKDLRGGAIVTSPFGLNARPYTL